MKTSYKKIFNRSLLSVIVGFCLMQSSPAVRGAQRLDMGDTEILERYTILPTGKIEFATGYLLRNGQFRVLTSDTGMMDLLGFSAWDIEPISGRPVMHEILFDGYKAAGVLPRWVRSRDTFYVGMYEYVIVSIAGGLDPNPTPFFYDQPQNDKVLVGETAYFFADAGPVGYITQEWKFRNRILWGEDGGMLAVHNVGLANVGTYVSGISTGGKAVWSKKASLKLAYPIIIKRHPRSQTLRPGKTYTARVAAQGTKPFEYQWFFNGSPIPGATNVAYTVRNVQPANAGWYRVYVDNAWSGVLSTNALLTVTP